MKFIVVLARCSLTSIEELRLYGFLNVLHLATATTHLFTTMAMNEFLDLELQLLPLHPLKFTFNAMPKNN